MSTGYHSVPVTEQHKELVKRYSGSVIKQYELAEGDLILVESEQKIREEPGQYYKFTVRDAKGKECKFKVDVLDKVSDGF